LPFRVFLCNYRSSTSHQAATCVRRKQCDQHQIRTDNHTLHILFRCREDLGQLTFLSKLINVGLVICPCLDTIRIKSWLIQPFSRTIS
jgi:hypothetical protein